MFLQKIIPIFIASLLHACFLSAMDPQSSVDQPNQITVKFDHWQGHSQPIGCLTTLWQADGQKFIISGSFDCSIKIWDLVTKSCVRTLQGHTAAVNALKVIQLDDENFIVSGSSDQTIKIWDPVTGKCVATLIGHSAGVIKIKSIDDNHIASLSSDGQIIIWNLLNGSAEQSFTHKDAQYLSWANKHLISASTHEVKMWNLCDNSCTHTITIPNKICGLVNIVNEPRFFVSTVSHGHEKGFYEVWDWLDEPGIMFQHDEPANPSGFPTCVTRYAHRGLNEIVLACTSAATFSLYDCGKNEIIWSASIEGSGPLPNVVTYLDGHIVFCSPISNDVLVSCNAILPD